MRRLVLLVLLVLLVTSTGCSASRFASLSSGSYECTATLARNTCEVTLATSTSRVVDLDVGGDLLSLSLPSSWSLLSAPDPSWSSVQFGAQANPLSYYVSGSMGCGGGSASTASDAQITELGDDALHASITHRFMDAAACAPVDVCELVFDVSCTRRP